MEYSYSVLLSLQRSHYCSCRDWSVKFCRKLPKLTSLGYILKGWKLERLLPVSSVAITSPSFKSKKVHMNSHLNSPKNCSLRYVSEVTRKQHGLWGDHALQWLGMSITVGNHRLYLFLLTWLVHSSKWAQCVWPSAGKPNITLRICWLDYVLHSKYFDFTSPTQSTRVVTWPARVFWG